MSQLRDRARALRKRPTDAEHALWLRLRCKRLGVRFRRQHPVAGYIVDFYCLKAKLAIEVDGSGHAWEEQRRYDTHRDRALSRLGVEILRVWNDQVFLQIDDVLELILERVHERMTEAHAG